MLYRTTNIYNANPKHKYPDVEVVWNEGWDALYKLRQVELGTKKDPEMIKWLLSQDSYRTILPYFKKLSQHYNNISEFMKVVDLA